MKTTIQFGPQHPVWIEPIRLKLSMDGEIVKDLEYEGGFVHRGIEKKFEWDYNKGPFLAERVCGICSSHHSTCYCLAAEKVVKAELPRRAAIIRTVLCELERLHSHLLAIGLTVEAIGFENLFMFCFRTREMVLDVFEKVTGNRVLHGINIVGGVTRNIGPETAKEIKDFLDALEKKCKEIENMIVGSYTIKQRFQGVGYISEESAKELGLVGPVARGSNIPYDIRYVAPYLVYKELKFEPIVEKSGDCWARSIVRVRELYQSIDMIRQCLQLLESAPEEIMIKPKNLPEGEVFARVEAPRGELFYYIRGKKAKELDRVKIRTSTYGNAPGIVPVIRGSFLADVGPITVTFDPCIGCIDR
jgi:Ni,Fe-hydrogenase III large subunit